MRKREIVKNEFKRYLFSYRTLLLLAVIILFSMISYYLTYAGKMELLDQLKEPAEDLNVEALKSWLKGYNGFEFFFTFYNRSDEFYITVLLLYAWTGIFVSGEMPRQRETGYGNLLVSRMGYSKYAKASMAAQTLYLAVVMAITVCLQLLIAFLFGGAETLFYKSGFHVYPWPVCVLIVLAIYLSLVMYCVLINLITSSCISVVRSTYLLQVIPVICFAALPMILFSTLANVFGWPQFFVDVFVPFNYLSMILNLLNTFYMEELLSLVVSLMLFAILAAFSVFGSIRRLERNYL